MQIIPIGAVPNQQLSVNIDSNLWTLTIKVGRECIFMDVLLNNEVVVIGQRIAVGTPVIPYDYLAVDGNFIWTVDSDELLDWQQFGITQQLIYVAPGELLSDA